MTQHKIMLDESHPEIAAQWHPTKNGDLRPNNITAGSEQKVWWLCPIRDDHEWDSSIYNRTSGPKSGCPCCSGHRVAKRDSLAYLYPALIDEWDIIKNNFSTFEVKPNKFKKAWWICRNDKSQSYECAVRTRVNQYEKDDICSCERCNSLGYLNPALANQWHPTLNGTKNPFKVSGQSHDKIWWLCDKNSKHAWIASIDNRAKGRNCPDCGNKRVNDENSLAALYPMIAAEWHPTKNGSMSPENVVPGSGKDAWWQCVRNSQHEWPAAIELRTKRNYGCPVCNSGWTVENIRLFVRDLLPYLDTLDPVDLYDLFQEKGLLNSAGKSKAFIQALKTGKFPKEEIENFVNNKNSLVDDFLKNPLLTLENDDEVLLGEMPEENVSYDGKELPLVEAKDIFSLLESNILTTSADVEKIDYLIKKARSKIWHHVYLNEEEANVQIAQYQGENEYARQVKKIFCEEYEGAKLLEIPVGYNFPHEPSLMQRYLAYLVKTKRRIGNWSGTGSGKTLSAILASRVIKAKLSIICCPNNVIGNWKRQISQAYPDSSIYTKESILNLKNKADKHQYLILNYDFFQQVTNAIKLKLLIEKCDIDFIVIDEIHYSKQRKPGAPSKRKTHIAEFLSEVSRKNEKICVLGMSATPVINELFEGKTLIELVTGIYHNELDTKMTVKNCVALYKKFVTHGIRYVPKYSQQLNVITEDIDCTAFIEQLRDHKTHIELDAKLTQIKIPYILEKLTPKTLIYTHYREGIEEVLKEAIEKKGWRVALFNGDSKDGLDQFIDGDIDILIATSCVGTGIDRLQNVCNNLIINCLPWTHAEFKQLIGRIYRQGQRKAQVNVYIPLCFVELNGERRSRCEYRWNCINRKKTFADAAVDGTIPEGHLKTKEQVHKEFMLWLQQIDQGDITHIERKKINLSLAGDIKKSAIRRIGDITRMNQQINKETSQATHQRFLKYPDQWYEYHDEYRETRKEWDIIPYQEAIKWCQARPHMVIGDLGCGEAFLVKELKNKVHSFDHIAINDNVIACDMSHVPLEDATLDAAIFSLSLMGTNFIDYLIEAKRCLRLDGHLWIAEPTPRIKSIELFEEMLERLGFDVRRVSQKWKFTFIEALKSDRMINSILLRDILSKDVLE